MTASERRLLAQEAAKLGSLLEDRQLDRLGTYVDLLRAWNDRVRLLGDRDPEALVRKHLPDCLALVPLLPGQGPVADVGTGPGLPGLVLACVRTDIDFWLVESRRRRVSFLHEVTARLELAHVVVLEGRAEEVALRPMLAGKAEVIVARALSLQAFIRYGAPLLKAGGRLLAMQSQKGSIQEARVAAKRSGFDVSGAMDYQLAGGERRRILTLARP